jgi:heme oxygenase
VISRHVQGLFGPDVSRSFLECYGSETGTQWQSFRAALVRFASSREIEERIIVGAQETFHSLRRWLAL